MKMYCCMYCIGIDFVFSLIEKQLEFEVLEIVVLNSMKNISL